MAGNSTRALRSGARFLGALALMFLAVCGFPSVRIQAAPLYRHALEQWPADKYSVLIFHHEPLSSPSLGLVEILEAAARESGANITVSVVDVNQPMVEPIQTLWFHQTGVEPPWMMVTTPGQIDAIPVWAGSLGLEPVSVLLESPARRKIVEGLLSGDAAVWVLLECGDSVRDEAAVDLLATELKQQEVKLARRPVSTNAVAELTRAPIKGGFSLVRVTRNDRAEEFFVTNLLHGLSLAHFKPVAFPIYGRGRTGGALVGRKLNAESIAAACAAITGACSNEAKARFPGRDLLVASLWQKLPEVAEVNAAAQPTNTVLAKVGDSSTTSRPALNRTNVLAALSNAVPAGGAVTTVEEPAEAPSGLSFWGVAAVVLLFTSGISYWVLRPKRAS